MSLDPADRTSRDHGELAAIDARCQLRTSAADLALLRRLRQARFRNVRSTSVTGFIAAIAASRAPDHACDLGLLGLEPCRVAPPRRLAPLGCEQPALLGENHPGKSPPV